MAGNGISPFTMALAYDQLIIATITEGGAAWVFRETNVDVDGDLENEWDKKKAGGQDGARAADKGYKLTEPKITWLIWNDELWKLYDDMLEALRPRPGKAAKPVIAVSHPILSQAGLFLFDVQKIPLLKSVGVDQWEASLVLLEHGNAPKKVKAKKDKAQEDLDAIAKKYARPDGLGGGGQFLEQQKGTQYDKPSQSLKPPGKK